MMQLYVYIYIYILIHLHMHIHMHIYIYVHTCVSTYCRQDASAAPQDLPVGPVPLAIFSLFHRS